MHDFLQTSLHAFAQQNTVLSAIAVFAASYLLFAMALGFVAIGFINLRKITWGMVTRFAIGLAGVLILTQILGRLVIDVRPYIAEHYTPLAHVATDNGFPSDHALVAALLSGFLLWLDRRWFATFAALTLIVGLGRLAIGAHHSLDILGSLLIAVVSLEMARLVPLTRTIFQGKVLSSKQV